ncbi:DUF397 domain-containing protein [Streptosporangium sp. CA-135522]|uniref:DUF397 domain-containing protein n=1 Tax=Streptosporangium sp. CA-135522 TaxID=3240072 RepID=UPI003D8BB89B
MQKRCGERDGRAWPAYPRGLGRCCLAHQHEKRQRWRKQRGGRPLADGSGRAAVRHSHHPDGEVVVYTRAEWEAFVGGVKDGEFDFPAG